MDAKVTWNQDMAFTATATSGHLVPLDASEASGGQNTGDKGVKPVVDIVHDHCKDNVEDDEDNPFPRLFHGLHWCGLHEEKHNKLAENYADRNLQGVHKNVHSHAVHEDPLYDQ